MKCYACDNDAAYECRRCGRVYCSDHGDELCAECLRPAGAVPSYFLYRGSLLALLVGSAVALWLLLKPPEEASESVPSVLVPAQRRRYSSGRHHDSARRHNARHRNTERYPAPVTSTPEAPSSIEHTVSEGDSLFSAEQYLPVGEDLAAFAERIADANGERLLTRCSSRPRR
jgi:hypothetical protein